MISRELKRQHLSIKCASVNEHRQVEGVPFMRRLQLVLLSYHSLAVLPSNYCLTTDEPSYSLSAHFTASLLYCLFLLSLLRQNFMRPAIV